MRCQIEKNKEILCDEIEKLSEQKISEANAAKLSAYRGAYKALCMAEKKSGVDYAADRSSKDRRSSTAYSAPYIGEQTGDHWIPFTHKMALEWTAGMKNSDGSKGPHWTMEQVRHVMEQNDIQFDLPQFFAVMNAVYSDYCAVAKKHGIGNKIDFYVDLAKAWLEDADAVEDKAARYFEYIVKH